MTTRAAHFAATIGMAILFVGPGCALTGFQQPTSMDYANAAGTTPGASEPKAPASTQPSNSKASATEADLATVLLSSPSPTEHEIFRGLLPGASRSDVQAQFPELEHDMVAMKAGSHAMFAFDKDLVHSLQMRIRHPDALAVAEEHWGAPTTWRTESGGTAYVWFDPQRKLRAVMKPGDQSSELSVEAYEPVRSFLGEGDVFAFEQGYSLLGSTRAELDARFPEQLDSADGNRAHLTLAATEHSDRTRVILNFDAQGRVEGYSFEIPCWRYESAKDDIRQAFVDKWGEPTPVHNGNYDQYARKPNILVRYNAASAWSVRVER